MIDFTRKMLQNIRLNEQRNLDLPKGKVVVEADTLNNRFNILMEEAVTDIKKKE